MAKKLKIDFIASDFAGRGFNICDTCPLATAMQRVTGDPDAFCSITKAWANGIQYSNGFTRAEFEQFKAEFEANPNIKKSWTLREIGFKSLFSKPKS